MKMVQKIEVHGIAIKPGISKNMIKYTAEECKNFAETLKGRPFLKDHAGYVDATIGLVTDSQIGNGNKCLYSGWIKEDGTGLLEKIEDNRIKEVSIGAFAKQIVLDEEESDKIGEDVFLAVGLEAMELSLTPVPAVKGTSLKQTLKNIELKRTGEKIKVLPVLESINDFSENNKEVEKMSEEEVKKEEEMTEEEMTEEQEETKDEAKEETEETSEEKVKKTTSEANVKVNVDTSKVDEAIKKYERLAELKEKFAKEEAKKVENTKGKVTKTEENIETKEKDSGFVVENSEYGNGVSLWKYPNPDGTY